MKLLENLGILGFLGVFASALTVSCKVRNASESSASSTEGVQGANTVQNANSAQEAPSFGTDCENAPLGDVVCDIKKDEQYHQGYSEKNGCDSIAQLSYTRCKGATPTNRAYHSVEGLPSRCYEDCPEGWKDHGISCYNFPNVLWKNSYDRGRGMTGCVNGQPIDRRDP